MWGVMDALAALLELGRAAADTWLLVAGQALFDRVGFAVVAHIIVHEP